MTKSAVYLETSVVGYATSRLGRDLVVAAHQQITREWFASRAQRYKLFVSQLVVIANAAMRQAIEGIAERSVTSLR